MALSRLAPFTCVIRKQPINGCVEGLSDAGESCRIRDVFCPANVRNHHCGFPCHSGESSLAPLPFIEEKLDVGSDIPLGLRVVDHD